MTPTAQRSPLKQPASPVTIELIYDAVLALQRQVAEVVATQEELRVELAALISINNTTTEGWSVGISWASTHIPNCAAK
jgi:hypothetical protein